MIKGTAAEAAGQTACQQARDAFEQCTQQAESDARGRRSRPRDPGLPAGRRPGDRRPCRPQARPAAIGRARPAATAVGGRPGPRAESTDRRSGTLRSTALLAVRRLVAAARGGGDLLQLQHDARLPRRPRARRRPPATPARARTLGGGADRRRRLRRRHRRDRGHAGRVRRPRSPASRQRDAFEQCSDAEAENSPEGDVARPRDPAACQDAADQASPGPAGRGARPRPLAAAGADLRRRPQSRRRLCRRDRHRRRPRLRESPPPRGESSPHISSGARRPSPRPGRRRRTSSPGRPRDRRSPSRSAAWS